MKNLIKLSSPRTQEYWEIPVLFEDQCLLAIDKPSDLGPSPDPSQPERADLMSLLHEGIRRGASWAQERGLVYLVEAHRFDLESSGIVLLAKDKPARIALADQFSAEKPTLDYVALVHGAPAQDSFEIEAPLSPHPVKAGVVRVDFRGGKKARTRVAVKERFCGYTLLHCQPLTDRAQQIRVHLRHSGLPLVGDMLYGGKALLLSRLKPGYRFKPKEMERPLIARVALHAGQLALIHPTAGGPITVTAPLPKDLTVAIKYLRCYAGSIL